MIIDNQKPFGEKVNITKEHFYSYCFEDPKGAPNTRNEKGEVIVKGEEYNNIFNLLNINDVVPLVAMHELGFTRYGIDMFFPDQLTMFNYESHFKNMKKLYHSVTNHEILGDYAIDKFQYNSLSGLKIVKSNSAHKMTQGLFLREFIRDLTLNGISHGGQLPLEECLKFYDENIQSGLRNIFKVLYESEYFKGSIMDVGMAMVTDLGIINEVDYLVSDLTIEGPKAFISDFKPLLARGLNKLAMDVDVTKTVEDVANFVEVVGYELFSAVLKGEFYQLLNWISVDNLKSVASGHYPELCAAHVRALDEQYVDNPFSDYEKMSGQYYQLVVNDTKTNIVITHDGETIVNINNGGEIDNQISYIKRFSGYEIYLPYYEHYNVQIGGECDYELSYWDNKVEDFIAIEKSGNSFVI